MVFPAVLSVYNVSFPGLGILDISVDNVAFRIGDSITVYWYGIILALALFTCTCLAILQAKKNHFSGDHVIDYALVCFPAAIVGARLYYVFSEWDSYKGDITKIIRVQDGGLAVIGGVLAAIIAGWILTKVKKLPVNLAFDFCIAYIPIGQAIGRWGNFVNQEAFGTNTSLPWGMISENTSAYLRNYWPSLDPNMPVHPTFLYESLATAAIFVVLQLIRKRSKFAFTVTASYMIFYGIVRFFIEGLRTDSLYIGQTGLRTSQVMSVVLIVVGLLLIAFSRYRGWKRSVLPVSGVPLADGEMFATEEGNLKPAECIDEKNEDVNMEESSNGYIVEEKSTNKQAKQETDKSE